MCKAANDKYTHRSFKDDRDEFLLRNSLKYFFALQPLIPVAAVKFDILFLAANIVSLLWCQPHLLFRNFIFTARCTLVQSAVLRSHVVCPSARLSARLSVKLVDFDHKGWNSSKIISRLVSVGLSLSADPNIMDLLQGEQPEILAQSDPPLLI